MYTTMAPGAPEVSTTEGIEREESSFGSTTQGNARIPPSQLLGASRGEFNRLLATTTEAPADDEKEGTDPKNLAEPAASAEAGVADSSDVATNDRQIAQQEGDDLEAATARLQGKAGPKQEAGDDDDDARPQTRPE
eukprot:TRINITY_DN13862_c0_g1_i1.p2 TRINITY_DN13862_c0_g1~~TRINITY_DN13862_c0_g1_i1.p2  ORF type:complete len:136 (-),score=37.11 TRINITY_DN13862_c0_g1_i1:23-430(-)